MNKLGILVVGLGLGLMSCEKPQMIELDEQGQPVKIVNSMRLTYDAPSATSKSADPRITLTINGDVKDFDLEDDHYYDDGQDEFVHFSQTYTTEHEGDLLRLYFSVLVNTNTNQVEDDALNFIEINEGQQIIDIVASAGNVNENDESISYDNNGISFRLSL